MINQFSSKSYKEKFTMKHASDLIDNYRNKLATIKHKKGGMIL